MIETWEQTKQLNMKLLEYGTETFATSGAMIEMYLTV